MKTIIVLLMTSGAFTSAVYSQVTNYGVGSGTQGYNNAFFGDGAGNATSTPRNTAVGSLALHMNAIGWSNTATGYKSLYFNTTGSDNTATGARALQENTTGHNNTSVGYATLGSNTTAGGNTAVGSYAINANTTGQENSALGLAALKLNNGSYNVAIGSYALYRNDLGDFNTANGYQALMRNTAGFKNTATGYGALQNNTTASYSTASGVESLAKNTTGHHNTAHGYRTLYENTIGYYNTAVGSEAMYSNIDGNFNVATGYYALYQNQSGTHNTASGFRSLVASTTGTHNSAQGAFALDNVTTGSYNSALGYNAGPAVGTFSNTTAIGFLAVPTASNQVRIGNANVTSIGGQVSWSTFSDGRFKKDIREDVSGLDFINALRPVSYTVDKQEVAKFLHIPDSLSRSSETKSKEMRQTGFVAQEVEAIVKKTGYVFYGVDTPDNENDHYSIRYAEFVMPLVKAVQELTAEVRDQKQKISEQDQKIESLTNQLKEKDAGKSTYTTSSHAVLFQNTPNPFTSVTEITMTLPDQIQTATIMIYNTEGRQMKIILVSDRGLVAIKIAANDLAIGIYFYTLIADGNLVDTKRMVLTP